MYTFEQIMKSIPAAGTMYHDYQHKAITPPGTIKAQKNLDYKALTNKFSLLFENPMVKLFSMFYHLSLYITY